MPWSLRSIGCWTLLIASLAGGVALVGYSLINWSLQDAPFFNKFNSRNRELLCCGTALLIFFRVCIKDRKFFPLKKKVRQPLRRWQLVCVKILFVTGLGSAYGLVWHFSKQLFQKMSIEWLRIWGHWGLMLLLAALALLFCIWLSEKISGKNPPE